MSLKTQKGFSLIELCIVMIIFGMIVTMVFGAYAYYNIGQADTKTLESMKAVEVAMTQFKIINNRYPCPADPSLSPANPAYGQERCDGAGITIVAGGRDTLADADTATPDPIMIGAVPITTLMYGSDNLPNTGDEANFDKDINVVDLGNSLALDGYAHKLGYAVTEYLTCDTDPAFPPNHCNVPFNDGNGAIEVKDENGNSVLGTPDTAHLVLISFGKDGKGAHQSDGTLASPCVPGAAPIPAGDTPSALNEISNCDNNGTFVNALQNDKDHSFYDDTVRIFINQSGGLWTMTGDTTATNTNPGYVGVGTNTPEEQFHVNGTIQATDFNAENYCAPDGTNCLPGDAFDPDRAAPEKMQCADGQIVTKIEFGKVTCEPAFPAGVAVSCPTLPVKKYLHGIRRLQGGALQPICCLAHDASPDCN